MPHVFGPGCRWDSGEKIPAGEDPGPKDVCPFQTPIAWGCLRGLGRLFPPSAQAQAESVPEEPDEILRQREKMRITAQESRRARYA